MGFTGDVSPRNKWSEMGTYLLAGRGPLCSFRCYLESFAHVVFSINSLQQKICFIALDEEVTNTRTKKQLYILYIFLVEISITFCIYISSQLNPSRRRQSVDPANGQTIKAMAHAHLFTALPRKPSAEWNQISNARTAERSSGSGWSVTTFDESGSLSAARTSSQPRKRESRLRETETPGLHACPTGESSTAYLCPLCHRLFGMCAAFRLFLQTHELVTNLQGYMVSHHRDLDGRVLRTQHVRIMARTLETLDWPHKTLNKNQEIAEHAKDCNIEKAALSENLTFHAEMK